MHISSEIPTRIDKNIRTTGIHYITRSHKNKQRAAIIIYIQTIIHRATSITQHHPAEIRL